MQQQHRYYEQQLQEFDRLRNIVKIEKELTACIEMVQPYLMSSYRTMQHATTTNNHSSRQENSRDIRMNDIVKEDDADARMTLHNNANNERCTSIIPADVLQLLQEQDRQQRIHHHHPSHQLRIRPIPTNMEQVRTILSVSRTYANRTSAPSGWTSTTPLIHFTTPNPLPHLLRHSHLATLQLHRTLDAAVVARKAVTEQKEKEQQQQQKAAMMMLAKNKRQRKEEEEDASKVGTAGGNHHPAAMKNHHTGVPPPPQNRTKHVQPQQQQQPISMNLSDDDDDSSSGSDDDDDENNNNNDE